MLAIFYFIILLPMKKRQKIASLPGGAEGQRQGDHLRGIYGTITKAGDTSVQLQIANNVRIEVSRAAIVGYQGQEPVGDALAPSKSE